MSKKNPVEIVVVVDRSGSMGMIKSDAIGGYNQFLKDQKAVKGAANLTLVLFDDEYLVSYNSVPIADVADLNDETFQPRGMTALNDAIGRSLATLEQKNPKKAIITILTDGGENASKEYNTAQVKEKIKAAEARGWQVLYLSADMNAVRDAHNYGVLAGNTVAYKATGDGMRGVTNTMSINTTNYRSS